MYRILARSSVGEQINVASLVSIQAELVAFYVLHHDAGLFAVAGSQ
jgi:hypothetical protein